MSLPPATRRLVPGLEEEAGDPRYLDFLIGRLLEEGDRNDLRDLCRRVDEAELADWLARRGERQLSRRSHAFWSLLVAASRPAREDDPLWLL